MIPFNDPVSLSLIVLSLLPYFVEVGLNEWWYWVTMFGFWLGYTKGYIENRSDIIYVAVHDLVRSDQDVYPLVRYTAPDGRQCWQPQSLPKVFRSMFLNIHCPLQLMETRNPRHVSVRQVIMKAEAYAYDMAHMESVITTEKKWIFNFKVESRKYISAPHNQDSPYDWIANATGYEQMFMELSKAQTENIERMANLDVAALKGAKMVMEAVGAKTPSREMMDELGIDLGSALDRSVRRMRKEIRRRQEEGDDDGQ